MTIQINDISIPQCSKKVFILVFILKVKQSYFDFISSLDSNIDVTKNAYVKSIKVKNSQSTKPYFELTSQRKQAFIFGDDYLNQFKQKFNYDITMFMEIEEPLLPRYYLQLCIDNTDIFDQMVYLNFDKVANKYFIGRCDNDESGTYQVKFTQKEIMELPFQKQIFRKVKANEDED